MAMAEATLAETEMRLKELQRFHDALAKTLRRWRERPAGTRCAAEFCDLIEESSAGKAQSNDQWPGSA